MHTYRMRQFSCPHCGAHLDATSPMPDRDGNETDHMPTDGDFSLCFNCVRPLILQVQDATVSARKPTEQESRDYEETFEVEVRRVREFKARTSRRRTAGWN